MTNTCGTKYSDPAERSNSAGCTIQNHGKDYHCFLRISSDNYNLTKVLETDTCRQNAEAVHIVIDNGQRNLRDRNAFDVFLQAVVDLPRLKKVAITIRHSRLLLASALSQFLRCAHQLQVLELYDIELDGSPYRLAQVLRNHPSLHTTRLKRCHCRPVHVLVDVLSTMPNLREITLDGSLLRKQCDADAENALRAVCQSPMIVKLELVDIPEFGATQQFMVMMKALEQQKGSNGELTGKESNGLQELALQVEPYESLPIGAMHAVARMLSHNQTITKLSVSWMGGADMMLPIIEEGIARNTALKEFRLVPGSYYCRKNRLALFSASFRERTAAALRSNTCLTYLWFDSWLDIDKGIDLYLRANQLGRGYLLQQGVNPREQPSHEQWMKALMASHTHAHLTYYWLSFNPSLLL